MAAPSPKEGDSAAVEWQGGSLSESGRDHDEVLHDWREVRVRCENEAREDYPGQPSSSGRVAVSFRQRKKGIEVSANHLLNFFYEPRPTNSSHSSHGGSAHHRRPNSQPQRPFSRMAFMQANLRFLVSDVAEHDFTLGFADQPVEWGDVVAVELVSTEPIFCPISLEELRIPQITPCAHVFSFTSIMEHIVSRGGSQQAVPCPLCFEPFNARELRCAALRRIHLLKDKDPAEFHLLKRPKNSCLTELKFPFVRVAYTKEAGACALLQARGLKKQFEELVADASVESQNGAGAVLQALESLALRVAAWAERRGKAIREKQPGLPSVPTSHKAVGEAAAKGVREVLEACLQRGTLEDYPALQVGDAKDDPLDAASQEVLRRPGNPTSDEEWQFFYQARDGQWSFLHPLNVRMLLHGKDSYDGLPATLTARVVDVESWPQTTVTRQRHKRVSHVPLNALVSLCEVDLAAGSSVVLTAETLASFASDLQHRTAQRAQKARKAATQSRKDTSRAVEFHQVSFPKPAEGPSLEELMSMPALGPSAASSSQSEASPPMYSSPPSQGVSYATLTRLGVMASGPALPTSTRGAGQAWGESLGTPGGAWGKQFSTGNQSPSRGAPLSAPSDPKGGSRKGKKIVLMSSGLHRQA